MERIPSLVLGGAWSVLNETFYGIDSDTEVVNTMKMGFTSKPGDRNISGTFYLDEFVSDSDA